MRRKENKLRKLCKKIDDNSWNQVVPYSVLKYFNKDITESTVEILGGELELSFSYTRGITTLSSSPLMQKISKVYNPLAQLKRRQSIEYNIVGVYSILVAFITMVHLVGDWYFIPKIILIGILLFKLTIHLLTASGITKFIKDFK